MSTKKNIFKNGIASVLQKGVKILEQLLLIPFFIKFWGAAYYGEWLTLTIVPSFLSLSDFGFGSAAANTFILKYAAGEKQEAANVAKTGLRIMTYVVSGLIFLTLAIVWVLNYFETFDKSLIDPQEAMVAVIILMISKALNFYNTLFEAYYRAARRASLSINFQTLVATLNVLCGFIVLVCNGRVVEYALVMLLITLVTNFLYSYFATRVLDLKKEGLKGVVDKKEIKTLFNKGLGYLLSPLWQALYFQGSTFIVRIVLGPVAVTLFNTLRTLIRSSSQFFAILIMATYPEFQFELAAGNRKKAQKIFAGTLGINIFLSLAMIIGLSAVGKPLYNLWTGKALDVPWSVWFSFVASIFFYALWFTYSFIFEALTKMFQYTIAGLTFATLSIGLTYFLIKGYGLNGLGWGTLSFDVFMCLYLLPKGASELGISLKDSFSEAILFMKQGAGKLRLKK